MITDKTVLERIKKGFIVKTAFENGLICAFSTREFNYDFRAGYSLGDQQSILKNREVFFKDLGLVLKKSVFLEQVHKAKVKKITKSEQGMGAYEYKSSIAQADAAITGILDTPLCMLSADCLPVFFWHKQPDAAGVAHAGWRGLKAGIVCKTAREISRVYKCPLSEIKVFIAPGIRACCYEVSSDFKASFPGYCHSVKKRVYLDLGKIALSQLSEAGIVPKNIIDSKLCTRCNNGYFFSYRAKDEKKRMLSLIALRGGSPGPSYLPVKA